MSAAHFGLFVVGLSHKTAPVAMRDRAALPRATAAALLHDLRATDGIRECVALSTCNRTEVYVVADDAERVERLVRRTLAGHTRLDASGWRAAGYAHQNAEAVSHLFRVAAGLDSMVLGESEIQGQVRRAAGTAAGLGVSGPLIERLFRDARKAGRRVRSKTGIGAGAVSISSIVVSLAWETFSGLDGQRGLMLGAGKMAEATARALLRRGLSEFVVANRSLGSARELAAPIGAAAVPLAELARELANADIVIASTESPGWLLGRRAVEEALRQRPTRPLLMVDIAVPRDLDPAIRGIPGCTLFDMDDLEQLANESLHLRRSEAESGERIVALEVDRFLAQTNPSRHVSTAA
jgi:glutamyl-tRNA reductase